MVLLLIATLSLLILCSLQRLVFIIRTNERIKIQHQAFYALESTAKMLQINFSKLPKACKHQNLNVDNVSRHVLSSEGCSFEQAGVMYSYLFLDLGVFPCLMISEKNEEYSSHHWWLIISSEQIKHQVLWIRFAIPEHQSFCASKSMIARVHHPMSWRISIEP